MTDLPHLLGLLTRGGSGRTTGWARCLSVGESGLDSQQPMVYKVPQRSSWGFVFPLSLLIQMTHWVTLGSARQTLMVANSSHHTHIYF